MNRMLAKLVVRQWLKDNLNQSLDDKDLDKILESLPRDLPLGSPGEVEEIFKKWILTLTIVDSNNNMNGAGGGFSGPYGGSWGWQVPFLMAGNSIWHQIPNARGTVHQLSQNPYVRVPSLAPHYVPPHQSRSATHSHSQYWEADERYDQDRYRNEGRYEPAVLYERERYLTEVHHEPDELYERERYLSEVRREPDELYERERYLSEVRCEPDELYQRDVRPEPSYSNLHSIHQRVTVRSTSDDFRRRERVRGRSRGRARVRERGRDRLYLNDIWAPADDDHDSEQEQNSMQELESRRNSGRGRGHNVHRRGAPSHVSPNSASKSNNAKNVSAKHKTDGKTKNSTSSNQASKSTDVSPPKATSSMDTNSSNKREETPVDGPSQTSTNQLSRSMIASPPKAASKIDTKSSDKSSGALGESSSQTSTNQLSRSTDVSLSKGASNIERNSSDKCPGSLLGSTNQTDTNKSSRSTDVSPPEENSSPTSKPDLLVKSSTKKPHETNSTDTVNESVCTNQAKDSTQCSNVISDKEISASKNDNKENEKLKDNSSAQGNNRNENKNVPGNTKQDLPGESRRTAPPNVFKDKVSATSEFKDRTETCTKDTATDPNLTASSEQIKVFTEKQSTTEKVEERSSMENQTKKYLTLPKKEIRISLIRTDYGLAASSKINIENNVALSCDSNAIGIDLSDKTDSLFSEKTGDQCRAVPIDMRSQQVIVDSPRYESASETEGFEVVDEVIEIVDSPETSVGPTNFNIVEIVDSPSSKKDQENDVSTISSDEDDYSSYSHTVDEKNAGGIASTDSNKVVLHTIDEKPSEESKNATTIKELSTYTDLKKNKILFNQQQDQTIKEVDEAEEKDKEGIFEDKDLLPTSQITGSSSSKSSENSQQTNQTQKRPLTLLVDSKKPPMKLKPIEEIIETKGDSTESNNSENPKQKDETQINTNEKSFCDLLYGPSKILSKEAMSEKITNQSTEAERKEHISVIHSADKMSEKKQRQLLPNEEVRDNRNKSKESEELPLVKEDQTARTHNQDTAITMPSDSKQTTEEPELREIVTDESKISNESETEGEIPFLNGEAVNAERESPLSFLHLIDTTSSYLRPAKEVAKRITNQIDLYSSSESIDCSQNIEEINSQELEATRRFLYQAKLHDDLSVIDMDVDPISESPNLSRNGESNISNQEDPFEQSSEDLLKEIDDFIGDSDSNREPISRPFTNIEIPVIDISGLIERARSFRESNSSSSRDSQVLTKCVTGKLNDVVLESDSVMSDKLVKKAKEFKQNNDNLLEANKVEHGPKSVLICSEDENTELEKSSSMSDINSILNLGSSILKGKEDKSESDQKSTVAEVGNANDFQKPVGSCLKPTIKENISHEKNSSKHVSKLSRHEINKDSEKRLKSSLVSTKKEVASTSRKYSNSKGNTEESNKLVEPRSKSYTKHERKLNKSNNKEICQRQPPTSQFGISSVQSKTTKQSTSESKSSFLSTSQCKRSSESTPSKNNKSRHELKEIQERQNSVPPKSKYEQKNDKIKQLDSGTQSKHLEISRSKPNIHLEKLSSNISKENDIIQAKTDVDESDINQKMPKDTPEKALVESKSAVESSSDHIDSRRSDHKPESSDAKVKLGETKTPDPKVTDYRNELLELLASPEPKNPVKTKEDKSCKEAISKPEVAIGCENEFESRNRSRKIYSLSEEEEDTEETKKRVSYTGASTSRQDQSLISGVENCSIVVKKRYMRIDSSSDEEEQLEPRKSDQKEDKKDIVKSKNDGSPKCGDEERTDVASTPGLTSSANNYVARKKRYMRIDSSSEDEKSEPVPSKGPTSVTNVNNKFENDDSSECKDRSKSKIPDVVLTEKKFPKMSKGQPKSESLDIATESENKLKRQDSNRKRSPSREKISVSVLDSILSDMNKDRNYPVSNKEQGSKKVYVEQGVGFDPRKYKIPYPSSKFSGFESNDFKWGKNSKTKDNSAQSNQRRSSSEKFSLEIGSPEYSHPKKTDNEGVNRQVSGDTTRRPSDSLIRDPRGRASTDDDARERRPSTESTAVVSHQNNNRRSSSDMNSSDIQSPEYRDPRCRDNKKLSQRVTEDSVRKSLDSVPRDPRRRPSTEQVVQERRSSISIENHSSDSFTRSPKDPFTHPQPSTSYGHRRRYIDRPERLSIDTISSDSDDDELITKAEYLNMNRNKSREVKLSFEPNIRRRRPFHKKSSSNTTAKKEKSKVSQETLKNLFGSDPEPEGCDSLHIVENPIPSLSSSTQQELREEDVLDINLLNLDTVVHFSVSKGRAGVDKGNKPINQVTSFSYPALNSSEEDRLVALKTTSNEPTSQDVKTKYKTNAENSLAEKIRSTPESLEMESNQDTFSKAKSNPTNNELELKSGTPENRQDTVSNHEGIPTTIPGTKANKPRNTASDKPTTNAKIGEPIDDLRRSSTEPIKLIFRKVSDAHSSKQETPVKLDSNPKLTSEKVSDTMSSSKVENTEPIKIILKKVKDTRETKSVKNVETSKSNQDVKKRKPIPKLTLRRVSEDQSKRKVADDCETDNTQIKKTRTDGFSSDERRSDSVNPKRQSNFLSNENFIEIPFSTTGAYLRSLQVYETAQEKTHEGNEYVSATDVSINNPVSFEGVAVHIDSEEEDVIAVEDKPPLIDLTGESDRITDELPLPRENLETEEDIKSIIRDMNDDSKPIETALACLYGVNLSQDSDVQAVSALVPVFGSNRTASDVPKKETLDQATRANNLNITEGDSSCQTGVTQSILPSDIESGTEPPKEEVCHAAVEITAMDIDTSQPVLPNIPANQASERIGPQVTSVSANLIVEGVEPHYENNEQSIESNNMEATHVDLTNQLTEEDRPQILSASADSIMEELETKEETTEPQSAVESGEQREPRIPDTNPADETKSSVVAQHSDETQCETGNKNSTELARQRSLEDELQEVVSNLNRLNSATTKRGGSRSNELSATNVIEQRVDQSNDKPISSLNLTQKVIHLPVDNIQAERNPQVLEQRKSFLATFPVRSGKPSRTAAVIDNNRFSINQSKLPLQNSSQPPAETVNDINKPNRDPLALDQQATLLLPSSEATQSEVITDNHELISINESNLAVQGEQPPTKANNDIRPLEHQKPSPAIFQHSQAETVTESSDPQESQDVAGEYRRPPALIRLRSVESINALPVPFDPHQPSLSSSTELDPNTHQTASNLNQVLQSSQNQTQERFSFDELLIEINLTSDDFRGLLELFANQVQILHIFHSVTCDYIQNLKGPSHLPGAFDEEIRLSLKSIKNKVEKLAKELYASLVKINVKKFNCLTKSLDFAKLFLDAFRIKMKPLNICSKLSLIYLFVLMHPYEKELLEMELARSLYVLSRHTWVLQQEALSSSPETHRLFNTSYGQEYPWKDAGPSSRRTAADLEPTTVPVNSLQQNQVDPNHTQLIVHPQKNSAIHNPVNLNPIQLIVFPQNNAIRSSGPPNVSLVSQNQWPAPPSQLTVSNEVANNLCALNQTYARHNSNSYQVGESSHPFMLQNPGNVQTGTIQHDMRSLYSYRMPAPGIGQHTTNFQSVPSSQPIIQQNSNTHQIPTFNQIPVTRPAIIPVPYQQSAPQSINIQNSPVQQTRTGQVRHILPRSQSQTYPATPSDQFTRQPFSQNISSNQSTTGAVVYSNQGSVENHQRNMVSSSSYSQMNVTVAPTSQIISPNRASSGSVLYWNPPNIESQQSTGQPSGVSPYTNVLSSGNGSQIDANLGPYRNQNVSSQIHPTKTLMNTPKNQTRFSHPVPSFQDEYRSAIGLQSKVNRLNQPNLQPNPSQIAHVEGENLNNHMQSPSMQNIQTRPPNGPPQARHSVNSGSKLQFVPPSARAPRVRQQAPKKRIGTPRYQPNNNHVSNSSLNMDNLGNTPRYLPNYDPPSNQNHLYASAKNSRKPPTYEESTCGRLRNSDSQRRSESLLSELLPPADEANSLFKERQPSINQTDFRIKIPFTEPQNVTSIASSVVATSSSAQFSQNKQLKRTKTSQDNSIGQQFDDMMRSMFVNSPSNETHQQRRHTAQPTTSEAPPNAALKQKSDPVQFTYSKITEVSPKAKQTQSVSSANPILNAMLSSEESLLTNSLVGDKQIVLPTAETNRSSQSAQPSAVNRTKVPKISPNRNEMNTVQIGGVVMARPFSSDPPIQGQIGNQIQKIGQVTISKVASSPIRTSSKPVFKIRETVTDSPKKIPSTFRKRVNETKPRSNLPVKKSKMDQQIFDGDLIDLVDSSSDSETEQSNKNSKETDKRTTSAINVTKIHQTPVYTFRSDTYHSDDEVIEVDDVATVTVQEASDVRDNVDHTASDSLGLPGSSSVPSESVDVTSVRILPTEQMKISASSENIFEEPTPKVVEVFAENSIVVPSPADSGIASPPVQESTETRVYVEDKVVCLCGQAAQYNCVCELAWYCGEECQLEDWESHKERCSYVPENDDSDNEDSG